MTRKKTSEIHLDTDGCDCKFLDANYKYNYSYSYRYSYRYKHKNKKQNNIYISPIDMVGGRGKKRDFGEEASASGDDGLRPQDLIYIFYFYFFIFTM